MGLSRSTYYDKPSSPADNTAIVAAMIEICDEFETYGYRRVEAELRHRGMAVNSKKVRRLMREHGLRPKRRKTVRGHDRQRPRWSDLPRPGPRQESRRPRSSMLGHAAWSDMRSAAQWTLGWPLRR